MRVPPVLLLVLLTACGASDAPTVTTPPVVPPVVIAPVAYTEPLAYVSVSATAPIVGQPFARQSSAQGGTPPYRWAVTSGAPPAGLSLSSAGVLTGTTTDTAAYSYTVKVTDAVGATSSVTISGKANKSGTLEFKIGGITLSVVGQNGQTGFQPFAQGGTPPYKFTVSGLPPGLSLDPATGTISGVATAAGNYTISIDLTDSKGTTAPRVSASLWSIAPLRDLPSGTSKYAGVWLGQFNLQYEMCPVGYGETSGPGGPCGRFVGSPPVIQYAALLTGSLTVNATMTLAAAGPAANGLAVMQITSLTLSDLAYGCAPCTPSAGIVTFNDPPLNTSTAGVGVAIILPGNSALVTANAAGNAHMSSGGSTMSNSLDPTIREATWLGTINLEPLEWRSVPGYKGNPGAKIRSTSWVLVKSAL